MAVRQQNGQEMQIAEENKLILIQISFVWQLQLKMFSVIWGGMHCGIN